MELEHLFRQSEFFLTLQLVLTGSLFIPGMIGRTDLYRSFVRKVASNVVSFGPMGLLVYVLYNVSRLG